MNLDSKTAPITKQAQMNVTSIAIGPKAHAAPYRKLTIGTNRGDVLCHYYPVSDARCAVVIAGGTRNAWDVPASGLLYPSLCTELSRHGVAALRVSYRKTTSLVESILDVLAGTIFLNLTGAYSLGVVGHAFSGAVAAQATLFAPTVKTLVMLSTQSYGAAEAVVALRGRTSILLMHGTSDEVLPATCSEYVYALAEEPKAITLISGAHHNLLEAYKEVESRTIAWLVKELKPEHN